MGLGGAGQAEARAPAGTALPATVKKDLLPTFRLCSHVLGALTRRKPMGSPTLAALLLSLHLLLIGLSASAGIGCPCLPCWNTRCLLASHMVRCRLLLGGDTCLAQAGKAAHSPVCPFLPAQVPVLWWQPHCELLHSLQGAAKVLVGSGPGEVDLGRKEPQ